MAQCSKVAASPFTIHNISPPLSLDVKNADLRLFSRLQDG